MALPFLLGVPVSSLSSAWVVRGGAALFRRTPRFFAVTRLDYPCERGTEFFQRARLRLLARPLVASFERRANGLLGGLVKGKAEELDKAFIERQRQRLTKLRNELADATQGQETEEKEINAQSSGQAAEYEDDAQRLTTLELDGNLVARNAQRLAQVNRALEKISEGTYGLSDASKRPIPKERLEATPEAIYTVAEQATRESTGLRAPNQK